MTKFALINDVDEGDMLIVGAGFTCMTEGQHKVIKANSRGLYIDCNYGKHYLSGQASAPEYIGLYKKQTYKNEINRRGWYCRYLRKEWGPFITERGAFEFAQNCEFKTFSTYYGHFFNYQKHKPKN